jgi:hypothetical protein
VCKQIVCVCLSSVELVHEEWVTGWPFVSHAEADESNDIRLLFQEQIALTRLALTVLLDNYFVCVLLWLLPTETMTSHWSLF